MRPFTHRLQSFHHSSLSCDHPLTDSQRKIKSYVLQLILLHYIVCNKIYLAHSRIKQVYKLPGQCMNFSLDPSISCLISCQQFSSEKPENFAIFKIHKYLLHPASLPLETGTKSSSSTFSITSHHQGKLSRPIFRIFLILQYQEPGGQPWGCDQVWRRCQTSPA